MDHLAWAGVVVMQMVRTSGDFKVADMDNGIGGEGRTVELAAGRAMAVFETINRPGQFDANAATMATSCDFMIG